MSTRLIKVKSTKNGLVGIADGITGGKEIPLSAPHCSVRIFDGDKPDLEILKILRKTAGYDYFKDSSSNRVKIGGNVITVLAYDGYSERK